MVALLQTVECLYCNSRSSRRAFAFTFYVDLNCSRGHVAVVRRSEVVQMVCFALVIAWTLATIKCWMHLFVNDAHLPENLSS